MDGITLRVIDGADRGTTFRDLSTPITIGREEGNTVQLNDERVSRFHVKLQEDDGKLVLTDLESTNGTRVNGEDVALRILRPGDLITVGKSVLVYGSRRQILERLRQTPDESGRLHDAPTRLGGPGDLSDSSLDFEFHLANADDLQALLFEIEVPALPDRLSPAQAAQLSELLEYLHLRIRGVLAAGRSGGTEEGPVVLDFATWQNLVDLQARVAEYLRRIADPDAPRED